MRFRVPGHEESVRLAASVALWDQDSFIICSAQKANKAWLQPE